MVNIHAYKLTLIYTCRTEKEKNRIRLLLPFEEMKRIPVNEFLRLIRDTFSPLPKQLKQITMR